MLVPRPVYQLEEKVELETPSVNADYIRWFLARPTWTCKCRVVNHGHNKFCAVCKTEPRPSSYIEDVFTGPPID